MSDIVLELQNVSRIFGEGDAQVKALDNVSLSIRRGEFCSNRWKFRFRKIYIAKHDWPSG